MKRIATAIALLSAPVLLSGCQNKFMASQGKPGDVRWAALVLVEDGVGCGRSMKRVTLRIRDNVLTVYPHEGYQIVLYTADLKGLAPDGSGRVVATRDTDQEVLGFGDAAHLTFAPGTGPRHIKVTSRYEDYCKYSIDPTESQT